MRPEYLIRVAKGYGDHVGLKLSTIGAYAVNDGKFFERLEAGGECLPRTAMKLLNYLAEYWPDDLEWPADIPRPDPSRDAA